MDNSFVLLMRNLENMLACPRSRCQAETPSPASFLILTPRKVDPYSPIRSRRGRDASEIRMLGAAVLPGGGVYSREPGALELIACQRSKCCRDCDSGLAGVRQPRTSFQDRKSTRLNSSHRCISYAVFC